MSSSTRRGGIPGPESRTGLTRPSMTEAEFERRLSTQPATAEPSAPTTMGSDPTDGTGTEIESAVGSSAATVAISDPAIKAGQAPAGPADVCDRGGGG